MLVLLFRTVLVVAHSFLSLVVFSGDAEEKRGRSRKHYLHSRDIQQLANGNHPLALQI